MPSVHSVQINVSYLIIVNIRFDYFILFNGLNVFVSPQSDMLKF